MLPPFVVAALLLGASAISQTGRIIRTSQKTTEDHKSQFNATAHSIALIKPDGSLRIESDSAGNEQASERSLLSRRACVNGDVKVTAENEGALSSVSKGKKYIPWVYYSNTWYPICGHYFWDDDNGATKVCQGLGFSSGKKDKKKSPSYSKDAMPVGECRSGQSLTACTDGGNAWGNFAWRNNDCRAGKNVRCLVKCYGGSNQQASSCSASATTASITVSGSTFNQKFSGGYCSKAKMNVNYNGGYITAPSYNSAVKFAWAKCQSYAYGGNSGAGYVSVKPRWQKFQFKCFMSGGCNKQSSSSWKTWAPAR